jgi:uncharacterized protein YjhX (UPF0386 family)
MASISAIRVRSAECSLVESALRVATLVYRTDGTAFARGGHIEIGKKRDDAAIKSYCCYIPTEFQKGEVDLCFYQCYVATRLRLKKPVTICHILALPH